MIASLFSARCLLLSPYGRLAPIHRVARGAMCLARPLSCCHLHLQRGACVLVRRDFTSSAALSPCLHSRYRNTVVPNARPATEAEAQDCALAFMATSMQHECNINVRHWSSPGNGSVPCLLRPRVNNPKECAMSLVVASGSGRGPGGPPFGSRNIRRLRRLIDMALHMSRVPYRGHAAG